MRAVFDLWLRALLGTIPVSPHTIKDVPRYVLDNMGRDEGVGYYIVKGAGIPRIDIVGNAGRVNWNQLISSIPKDFSGASVQ